MILSALSQAQQAGARLSRACAAIGLDTRTVQRWRQQGELGEDRRHGPKQRPSNQLSARERQQVLEIANSPEYRDLSPKQIVPKLADLGRYVASDSTFYRVLRAEEQLTHRERSKPRTPKPPPRYLTTGRLQVWSWDITYLRSPVLGEFYYLYLHVDIWSRKIVGWAVHERECGKLARAALKAALASEGVDGRGLVVHQDNGSPMKEATLKATMERLGVIASYSRPRVSDDNAYSEALFRTLKYRPQYPDGPFESLEAARAWVEGFVAWYNHEHLHSGLGWVTPAQRHDGQSGRILAARRLVYAQARRRHPERWSGSIRAWEQPMEVWLNPPKINRAESKHAAQAA